MLNYLNHLEDGREPGKNEYLGDDGLIHCSVCKKPKQAISECKNGSFKHRSLCDCDKARIKKEEEEAAAEENRIRKKELTRRCFDKDTNFVNYTFENSKHDNTASNLCFNYCEKWEEIKKNKISLLLCGSVGSGKTYLACSVCNKLIQQHNVPVKFITEYDFINNYSASKNRNEYLDSLAIYPLLVLDDFGSKCFKKGDGSNGFLSFINDLIDIRYRRDLPMIITTNLPKEQFTKTSYTSIDEERVFSRILEMAGTPIDVVSNNKRKENAKNKIDSLKKLM